MGKFVPLVPFCGDSVLSPVRSWANRLAGTLAPPHLSLSRQPSPPAPLPIGLGEGGVGSVKGSVGVRLVGQTFPSMRQFVRGDEMGWAGEILFGVFCFQVVAVALARLVTLLARALLNVFSRTVSGVWPLLGVRLGLLVVSVSHNRRVVQTRTERLAGLCLLITFRWDSLNYPMRS